MPRRDRDAAPATTRTDRPVCGDAGTKGMANKSPNGDRWLWSAMAGCRHPPALNPPSPGETEAQTCAHTATLGSKDAEA